MTSRMHGLRLPVMPAEFLATVPGGRFMLGRRLVAVRVPRSGLPPGRPEIFQPEGDAQDPSALSRRRRSTGASGPSCAAQGEPLPPEARVTLVAMPRAFGKSYNPASLPDGDRRTAQLACGIAEVHNTFGERKAWFLGAACRSRTTTATPTCSSARPSAFYVSPFSEARYRIRVHPPPAPSGWRSPSTTTKTARRRLTLVSAWTGKQVPLTDLRLLWLTVKSPLLILKVVTLIHLHAAWLWLVKKLPFPPQGG